MYLFPLVGAIIGFAVGALAYMISFYFPTLVVGFIVVLMLVTITGVSHIDALADFADGVMARGGKEAKHRAMDDPAIGSAGTVALILYIRSEEHTSELQSPCNLVCRLLLVKKR